MTKDILTTSNPQKNKSVGGFPNARGLVPDYYNCIEIFTDTSNNDFYS